jgi:hypothetical protein
MTTPGKPLTTLRFHGGRFEASAGFLEIDTLPELLADKKLVVETAKALRRARNPQRERLPRYFEDGIRMFFQEFKTGSARVPIARYPLVDQDDGLGLETEDDVAAAGCLIDDCIKAGNAPEAGPLPERFPRSVLVLFEDFGRALQPDEGVESLTPGRARPADYTPRTRSVLVARAGNGCEDPVDVTGEGRGASLRLTGGGDFTLSLDNGGKAEGIFSPEQEARLTQALHGHQTLRLRVRGTGQFDPNGALRRIKAATQVDIVARGEAGFDPAAKPIWEIVEEIGRFVPLEARARVPTDGARHLDHHLYDHDKAAEE